MVRELDQSRRAERGDTARFAERQAIRPAARRTSRALQSHRRSKLDNSGTSAGEVVRARFGMRGRAVPVRAVSCRRGFRHSLAHVMALRAEIREACTIRRRQCTHDEIELCSRGQHVLPYELPQAPFHTVPLDRGVGIPRNDQSRAGVRPRRSKVPNFQVRRPKARSLQAHGLELSLPREPPVPREAAALRRRRTSRAA